MIYFTLGIQYQHVLLHAIEERNIALDNGQHVGVVLMDLSKAFDDIPHGLLLTILYTYCTSIYVCEMIRSYLINRMQTLGLMMSEVIGKV